MSWAGRLASPKLRLWGWVRACAGFSRLWHVRSEIQLRKSPDSFCHKEERNRTSPTHVCQLEKQALVPPGFKPKKYCLRLWGWSHIVLARSQEI